MRSQSEIAFSPRFRLAFRRLRGPCGWWLLCRIALAGSLRVASLSNIMLLTLRTRFRLVFGRNGSMSVENVNVGESLFPPSFSSRDTLSAHCAVSLTESDNFSLFCTASNDMTNKFPEK